MSPFFASATITRWVHWLGGIIKGISTPLQWKTHLSLLGLLISADCITKFLFASCPLSKIADNSSTSFFSGLTHNDIVKPFQTLKFTGVFTYESLPLKYLAFPRNPFAIPVLTDSASYLPFASLISSTTVSSIVHIAYNFSILRGVSSFDTTGTTRVPANSVIDKMPTMARQNAILYLSSSCFLTSM